MQKHLRVAFTLAFMILLSGCIFAKNLSQLWSSASVDESLCGTWVDAEDGSIFQLLFEVSSSNMLCTVTTNEESNNQRTAEPARCRSIKDAETDICFLLFPDTYNLMPSNIEHNEDEGPDGMGMLVPYRITADGNLIIYSHLQRVLSARIDANELHGGVVREGGNPPSRMSLRPFVENPSLASLHLISTDVVNTNEIMMAFKRGVLGCGAEIKLPQSPLEFQQASGIGNGSDDGSD